MDRKIEAIKRIKIMVEASNGYNQDVIIQGIRTELEMMDDYISFMEVRKMENERIYTRYEFVKYGNKRAIQYFILGFLTGIAFGIAYLALFL